MSRLTTIHTCARQIGTWSKTAALITPLFFALRGPAQTADAPSPSPPPPTQRLDPEIQQIVTDISAERIAVTMRKLESFETRNTLSDPGQTNRGIGLARQWILEEFKSYSPRLEVSFDTHTIPKGGRVWKNIELRNVVAILPGKMAEARDRRVLISGHYDTVNLKDAGPLRGSPEKAAELPAPGVSDDASGTACALECARVFSQHDFDATVVFVAFAGEEQGLLGAHAMARRMREEKREIEAVLNNDIIGNDVGGNGGSDNRRVLLFSEGPEDSPSREVARFTRVIGARYFPEMAVDLVFRHDRFGRGGDHTAFNQEGYAGVRFTTPNENFSEQHSAADTYTNASPDYAARVTRINAAAAAALALAPRPPVTKAANLTRGTNGYDAVLRWESPNPEPDLAGYMVVVRSTTAPDWEREIWVGPTNKFTLANTPIDQLVIGVKAVDREGHESPASAYVVPAPAKTVQSAAAEKTP